MATKKTPPNGTEQVQRSAAPAQGLSLVEKTRPAASTAGVELNPALAVEIVAPTPRND